ncbi:MAG: class I SAM-dependent methyltransferase, partial [Comamonadaceae bacterium]
MSAALLQRYLARELSAEMTLMYWLKTGASPQEIGDALAQRPADGAIGALQTLLHAHWDGCLRIARMVSAGVDTDAPAPSTEAGLRFCRRLFDWSVAQSPESSVALYSLGSPELLQAATDEVVAWLQAQRLIAPPCDVLEIGCGIGRFEVALAPRVASVRGIDVSPAMVEEARRRCAGLPNVVLDVCDGRGLAMCADASHDLVLAIDSFPYLFQSGWPLLLHHFHEARRVLRPGGALCVMELSYGRTPAEDVRDFIALAAAAGLQPGVCGAQPFRRWDGMAFVAF